MNEAPESLDGLKVLDLTRILAGPTCTQLLGDLGCDIIKVERPGAGDDTRKWGPPYLKDGDGFDTTESAYYLCANRNKRSISIDIAKPQGAALVRRLLGACDIMIHNFKVGGMEKFGLGYDQIKDEFPNLVYCSISGFGQTGPYASRPGYDVLAQGLGGIMSITGEADGEPMKVGVGIADLMCGMYATVAILAAIRHRDQGGDQGEGRGGRGQHIDMALLDTQMAWLINEGLNYLVSGEVPFRRGTGHPNIVPYQSFPTSDGHFLLAVGNDSQYQRFCGFAGAPELATDPRFATNSDRVQNRDELVALVSDLTRRHPRDHWINGLEKLNVPAGPVNSIKEAFDDPQVRHRQMEIAMNHPLAGDEPVHFIGNPIKMSGTPPAYRRPPPTLGQHTDEVLKELLNMDDDMIAALRRAGIV